MAEQNSWCGTPTAMKWIKKKMRSIRHHQCRVRLKQTAQTALNIDSKFESIFFIHIFIAADLCYLQNFLILFSKRVEFFECALAIHSIRVDIERLAEWIFIDATAGAAVATKSQFTCVQCVSRKQVTQLPIYTRVTVWPVVAAWVSVLLAHVSESVCNTISCLAFLVAGVRL